MTANETRIRQFFIKVDGADLPGDVMDCVDGVTIEDDLAQPAMFELHFHDPQLSLIDGERFALGKEVSLGANDRQGRRRNIVIGEITGLEPRLSQRGPTLTVRGYDRSHQLHRGRKTRTFLQQSDGDIASKIASDAGLRAEVEAGERHDYVMQDNQTDMEFLRTRAERIGYTVLVGGDNGRSLQFKRAPSSPPRGPSLEFGVTLLSFDARLTAVAQANEVQVRGWDAQNKRAIVGRAASAARPSQIGDGRSGGEAAQRSFGSAATRIVVDRPVASQSEADKLAQAILDEMAGDYLAAEGSCLGEPELRAGTLVELTGVGRRLAGSYYVTATRHSYNPAGYMTTFWVSGRRPTSLLGTIEERRPRHMVEGVSIGIVTNINDPERLGRVKLKFPWLDENHESHWARLATPGAGSGRGFFALPEVDDEVLVAFEQGDINRPYVIGGLWNGKDKPPAEVVQGDRVQTRTFKTRAGHIFEIKDDDGQGQITLKTKNGNQLVINDSGSGSMTIECASGTIDIKGAGGKLSISQSGVELNATGNLVLKGALVQIN